MGKKALIKELEAALSQTLSDLAIDRQRHAMVVNAMTAGMQRLTEERDEAETNAAELLRNNETADSVIRDLRRELEVLDGVASMFERDLATLQEQHTGMSDARDDLLKSLISANTLIWKLRSERDGLHGRCAALSDELDALKATQAQQHEYASQWGALCFRLGNSTLRLYQELKAKDDAAPAEPVAVNAITLQKIDALDIGERLIDDEGMMVGRRRDDYYVFKPGLGTYSTTNYDSTLRLYQELKAKA